MTRWKSAQRVWYLGGSLSVGIFSAFNNFTMALWLNQFTTSYVLISLLANTKSVEGAIVSPLAGAWSDRAWLGWLGRRRPFILVGGLTSALLIALTPTIARLPPPPGLFDLPAEVVRLLPLVAAIFLSTLTFNLADDIHKALRADIADGPELNWLSSFATVVDIGGQVSILVLGFLIWRDEVPDSAFLVAAALVAFGALVTVLGGREPTPAEWEKNHRAASASEGGAESHVPVVGFVRRYPGAVMFVLVTFAYWSGVNAVLPLVSIYVRDILGASVGEAQLLPGLLLLSTTVMAIPMAWLGTKFGKRRMLAIGYTIMGFAALIGLVITTKEQGAVLFLLAGVGNSASIVLAIPLMADLVPRHHMGAATGLLAASGSVAAPLASIAGGMLSQIYGPRAIFAVMAVMVVIAIGLLARVQPGSQESAN